MTSSILLKKQEEQNAKLLRDLLRLPENKKCFDCPTKSPFFVNTTLQTFVCTRCSGLVREVGHRVKSISASTFTAPELTVLALGGNGVAGKIWLSCGYNTIDTPEPESDGEVRAFMRQKYFERKWLNRDLAVSHDQTIKQRINELFTEEGLPRQQARRRHATIDKNATSSIALPLGTKESHCLKNIPKPLDLTSTYKVQQPTIQTAPLFKTSYQPQPNSSSSRQPKVVPASAPLSPAPTLYYNQQQTTPTEPFFADLSGLTLSCPSRTQSATLAPSNSRNRDPRDGNMSPTSSKDIRKLGDGNNSRQQTSQTIDASTSNTTHTDRRSSFSNHHRSVSLQNPDPYSALRAHHEQEQLRHEQMRFAISSITQSTKHLEEAKRHDPPTDPYAALRQMSFEPVHDSFGSQPSLSSPSFPQSSPPNGPRQQQHYSSLSRTSNYTPSDQDNHPSKMTREWIDTQPFIDDEEDLMTQISNTTSQSTSSSQSQPIMPKNPSQSNIDSIFGDLDPLANYKRNKTTTIGLAP